MTSGTGSWCPESRYTDTHCSTVVIVTLQLSVGFEKKEYVLHGNKGEGVMLGYEQDSGLQSVLMLCRAGIVRAGGR